jgi:tetratricopeptide (TPR) repeat protein
MKPSPSRASLALVLSAFVIAGCASTRPPATLLQSEAVGAVPLFEGLGPVSRKISTSSAEAQRYFDQGLAFLFAFNHDEAMRSFRKAAELDPHAAMAWWGVAYAQGPHINFPMMTPVQAATAWDAVQRAQKESRKVTDVEAALIDALAKRYVKNPPADRKPLDEAYASAMGALWKRYPQDADIGAFYAESMMDLRPWNQWTREGQPNPGTLEVLATLDAVIRINPFHPLANHLYIHATEASLHPERADDAADRLRDLQPGLGHNVHMPSHIDVRRGRWRESMIANQKAIRADQNYRAKSPQQEFYGLYMAHNHHMLAFSAMMVGQKKETYRAIDTMSAAIPPAWAEKWAPIADGFLAMPLEVRVRFGDWDQVLAAPEPAATFPFARTMRHYARGVAYSAKGDTASARAEQAAFTKSRAAVAADCLFGNNKCSDLLGVADRVLDGEISYREGKSDAAFAALQQAVALEDKLNYDEPPSWILPARHTLGAAYLDAKRPKEAEAVFRDDLEKLPHNGWGLFGLAKSLRDQGKRAEAAKVDAQFRKAWEGSDFEIASPCACLASPVASR